MRGCVPSAAAPGRGRHYFGLQGPPRKRGPQAGTAVAQRPAKWNVEPAAATAAKAWAHEERSGCRALDASARADDPTPPDRARRVDPPKYERAPRPATQPQPFPFDNPRRRKHGFESAMGLHRSHAWPGIEVGRGTVPRPALPRSTVWCGPAAPAHNVLVPVFPPSGAAWWRHAGPGTSIGCQTPCPPGLCRADHASHYGAAGDDAACPLLAPRPCLPAVSLPAPCLAEGRIEGLGHRPRGCCLPP